MLVLIRVSDSFPHAPSDARKNAKLHSVMAARLCGHTHTVANNVVAGIGLVVVGIGISMASIENAG